jgi:hypothetical protein
MIRMNFADGKSRLDVKPMRGVKLRIFATALFIVWIVLGLGFLLRLISRPSDLAVTVGVLGLVAITLLTVPTIKLIWRSNAQKA